MITHNTIFYKSFNSVNYGSGVTVINKTFLNKSKLLQKFSPSLQNKRHYCTKNNTIQITIMYKILNNPAKF